MSLLFVGVFGLSLLFVVLALASHAGRGTSRRPPHRQLELFQDAHTLPTEALRRRTRGEPTREERIQTEIGRRLDSLQQHRAMFLAQDRNHDGYVDEQEWARARAEIEAEVRAEMGETDGTVGEPPSDAAETPGSKPPPETDGSW